MVQTIQLDDTSVSLQKEAKKLLDIGILSTSVLLKEVNGKKNMVKKPRSFNTLNKKNCLKSVKDSHNCLTILTGERSNIVVIDIDNKTDPKIKNGLELWKSWIKSNGDIATWKVKTGNNGFHYYFKYDDKTKDFKTKSNLVINGYKYSIDVRNKAGIIYAPPTVYESENNFKKYTWQNNPFITELLDMPEWLYEKLYNKENVENYVDENIIEHIKDNEQKEDDDDIIIDSEEDFSNDLTYDNEEVEEILNMLSDERRDNYDDWIKVGMCIYNMTNGHGLDLWRTWSKKSNKYQLNDCEKMWKGFKNKGDKGLQKGSLLHWAKEDESENYNNFKNKKQGSMIIANKFSNINTQLIMGETRVVNDRKSITLHNDKCIFTGKPHSDMKSSMYIDIYDNKMDIKCRHETCLSKTFPFPAIKLSKQESKIVNYNTLNLTVNNYNNYNDNEDLIEFDKFDIYDDEQINELVYNSLNGTDGSFADILYYLYKNDYNYGEDNNWYIFEKHRWSNIGNKNHYLEKFGRQKIKELYAELLEHCKKNNLENAKIKEIRKIKNSITKQKVIRDVIEGAKTEFFVNNNRNRDFVKKLDTNSYLIGFENGIYDLKTHTFRDGKQDDRITMSVGYDYSDKRSDNYNSLIQFLKDIQPDEKERDYLLTFLSTALFGNSLELFTILTGKGRNGKSKLIELLKMTFGDYYGSVKSQLFTRPQPDASAPDPGLLNLQRKKLVISSEPEKNQKLNSGFIKFITGRDSTQLRACHQNDMVDFEPTFVTLFVCNDIPETDDIDTAFSKRLRCINFPTEFCDKPTKDNQKQINTAINENFNSWRNELMLLLIEHYKIYQTEKKLVATKNILKWTKKYEAETDVYLQFLNECTEEKEGEKLKTNILYPLFKEWWNNNFPSKSVGRNVFTKEISKYVDIKKIRFDNTTTTGIENLAIKICEID